MADQVAPGAFAKLEAIRFEFPDFDLATLPAIPADWTDESWHNDECPKFASPSGFVVFIDAEDPDDRAYDGDSRFGVCRRDAESGDLEHLLDSSDWAEVLAIVEGR
jgi:hypothetical protein